MSKPKSNLLAFDELDPDFKSIVAQIHGRTLIPPRKLWNLYHFARIASPIHGNAAEVGVFRGGGAKLMCLALPDKYIHLFDTFEGMPETNPVYDLHQNGDFSETNKQEVAMFLKGHKVRLHKGLFPNTAKGYEGPFCFVHIDVDIYSSTLAAAQYFRPRMSKGGIILVDDYGARSCPGAKRAVEEYFGNGFIPLEAGQALVLC